MNCELCKRGLTRIKSSYFSCSNCGFTRKKHKSEWSSKGTKWEGDHLKIYLDGEKWRRKVFRSRINLLKYILNSESEGVDIGSAAGLFVKECNSKFKSVSAVEVDSKFSNYSKKINKVPHYSSIYDLTDTYDFVTCFDTLGYSLDIEKFLTKVIEIIKPGGHLIMSNVSIKKGINSLTDTSFNYYFEDIFWDKTFPSSYKLKKVKNWSEVKTFNTQEPHSPGWWADYLFMSNNKTIINYSIYQKPKNYNLDSLGVMK
jgi:2-polyprenyl-3-methyl-5-hydroxy-6-metoxy-1,4-benzoquinol methylase